MQLSELRKEVGILKGKIAKHKAQIAKLVQENQTEINGFLQTAGYRYHVEIKPEADTYKMKLVHEDLSDHLEEAKEYISYGERNAFALVLFLYQVSSSPEIGQ